MNFYPIYKNKKLLPWIKWWLIKGNKVMPKHLSEWIDSAEAITLTGVYKGSPLLYLNLKGNTSQTGTPTPEAPVPVNVVKGNNTIKINDTDYQVNLKGKNLLKLDFSNDSNSVAGLTFSHTDSTFTLNGTATGGYRIFTLKNNLPIQYNDDFYFSANVTGTNPKMQITLRAYDSSNNRIWWCGLSKNNSYRGKGSWDSDGLVDHCTFTIESLENGGNYDLAAEVQLEESSTATTYEPYYDYELCKIGDYQDVIYKENNKWYVDKYIEKVVLNGSESYSYSAGNKNTLLKNIGMISANVETTGYVKCNYYEEKGNASADSVDYAISRYGATGTYNYQKLVFKNKDITSASAFQTWLSTHNTTVYYVLAESTTTEITETNLLSQLEAIYNAKLQSGTNTITQTPSDLPFYLNFRYYEKG